MKNLNRKEYKKTLKEFRKTCPITQVDHQWIWVIDEYQNPCLMFVHGNLIKRGSNSVHDHYNCFKFNGFNFKVILYGSKSLYWDPFYGIKTKSCYSSVTVNNKSKFKILTEDEISDIYDKIFDDAKKYHKYVFTGKY